MQPPVRVTFRNAHAAAIAAALSELGAAASECPRGWAVTFDHLEIRILEAPETSGIPETIDLTFDVTIDEAIKATDALFAHKVPGVVPTEVHDGTRSTLTIKIGGLTLRLVDKQSPPVVAEAKPDRPTR